MSSGLSPALNLSPTAENDLASTPRSPRGVSLEHEQGWCRLEKCQTWAWL